MAAQRSQGGGRRRGGITQGREARRGQGADGATTTASSTSLSGLIPAGRAGGRHRRLLALLAALVACGRAEASAAALVVCSALETIPEMMENSGGPEHPQVASIDGLQDVISLAKMNYTWVKVAAICAGFHTTPAGNLAKSDGEEASSRSLTGSQFYWLVVSGVQFIMEWAFSICLYFYLLLCNSSICIYPDVTGSVDVL